MRTALLIALAGCKASLGADMLDAGPDGSVTDGASDALVLGPWGAPAPVGIPAVADDDPTLTADLLELYFNRSQDIYVSTRATATGAWSMPVVVTALSTAANETTPEVSYDGLTMYLASAQPGTLGLADIWVSTRASRLDAWQAPVHVGALSSVQADGSPNTLDGLTMVLDTDRRTPGTIDVFTATRASTTAPWGTPTIITELSSADDEGNPMLAPSGREIYFDSNRSGGGDLFVAHRTTTTSAWGAAQPITELNSASADSDAWLAPDGRTIFFTSNRDGTQRLWQASR